METTATQPEPVWTTALGERKRRGERDHQHLSNIIWFNRVFNGRTRTNCAVMASMADRLTDAFKGDLLPWRPLPIPREIGWLRNAGLLDTEGNIVFQGDIIGSVRHIPGWRDMDHD